MNYTEMHTTERRFCLDIAWELIPLLGALSRRELGEAYC